MGHNGSNDWQTAQLGDVMELFDHQRVPLNSRERQARQGEYPYYGAQGIIDHIDDYIFDGRYILVAEDGENLNSKKLPLALFATGKFWVNNHAHILRGKLDVADDTFLLACLNNADIKPFVTGAAQPKLSQANLRQIEIPLPPLPVQRRIAGILSAYDDLIENNQRRIKILEEMARSLYREWFVNFRFPGHEKVPLVDSPLGSIPKRWEVKTLDQIAENFDRLRKPLSKMQRAEIQGVYPYYGAAKVFDYINDFIFDGEYLLMAEDGSVVTIERAPVLQLVNEKFWPNNHTHILRGKPPFATHFLYLGLSEVDISPYITGAAQPKITQENMNRIPFFCGPETLHLQFNRLVAPMISQSQVLQRRTQNLRRTRDLLLPRLLSGQGNL